MFQLHLQAQVINPKKGIVKSKAWVSKSFLKNFLGCLAPQLDPTNTYETVDTGATTRTNDENGNAIYCPQGYGGGYIYGMSDNQEYKGDELGIVIGIGSAANSAITYTLHNQIDHGIGSGEMEYFGGCFDDNPTVDGNDSYFDIERIFRNSSGGTISVSEYGIIVYRDNQSSYPYPTLIVRDVFSGIDIVDVDDGEYFKVTYRFYVTV